MNRFPLAFCIALAGCATYQHPQPAQFYEGSPLPPEQVARIRVPNVGIWVTAVDGKSTRDAFGNLLDKSEVLVMPGSHRLALRHTRGAGGIAAYQLAEGEVVFTAEPGHMYTARYRDTGDNKIQFFIKDHGTDYDKRCLSQKDRPNVMIVIGETVPIDCY